MLTRRELIKLGIVFLVISSLLFAVTLIEHLTRSGLTTVNAQDSSSFAELLRGYKAEVESQKLEVIFRFVTPISGTENEWTIPDHDAEGNYINRAISEVGDDYICFAERFGEVLMENCTPFLNIASVRHVE